MPERKKDMLATLTTKDDAPELTDDWFEHADLHNGEKLVRRGRPKSASKNIAVSLRIPPDTLQRWKSSGPGWQTRMVRALEDNAPNPA